MRYTDIHPGKTPQEKKIVLKKKEKGTNVIFLANSKPELLTFVQVKEKLLF